MKNITIMRRTLRPVRSFVFFLVTGMFMIPVLFSADAAYAEKKEKKNKVKSTTVFMTVYDQGKPVKYKDSYEEFDKNGLTTLRIEYDKDGTVSRKETSKYDLNGNLTEGTVFDEKSKKDIKKVYKYNMQNDLTEEAEYSSAGKLIKKISYSYTVKGKKGSEVTTDSNGKTTKKVLNTYNSNKMKTTRQIFSGENTPESLKEWQYDYY
jgi:hypothetical protein